MALATSILHADNVLPEYFKTEWAKKTTKGVPAEDKMNLYELRSL